MGQKNLGRLLRDMVVNGVRAASPLVDTIPERCKYCKSRRIVRYGHYQNIQRWWCNDYKRKFVHNKALSKMKTPIIQIASALSMFYEGMSLNGIRRQLEQTYRNYPSDSNVYAWVVRFTNLAIKTIRDYKPNVGDLWIADETVLRIEGRNTWF